MKVEMRALDTIKPYEKLAFHGWIKTHVGGNKVWEKDIS